LAIGYEHFCPLIARDTPNPGLLSRPPAALDSLNCSVLGKMFRVN